MLWTDTGNMAQMQQWYTQDTAELAFGTKLRNKGNRVGKWIEYYVLERFLWVDKNCPKLAPNDAYDSLNQSGTHQRDI